MTLVSPSQKKSETKVRSLAAGAVVVIVLVGVLAALTGSWYTIDQGDRGVLLTNGALSSVVDPGLHFKLPWFQHVEKVSLRQQVLKWGCETGTDCDGLPAMQAYSRDQQPADMRVTVNFHVPAAEVGNVYTNYGSIAALADRVIARKAPQEIKTVFGQYDAVSLSTDARQRIKSALETASSV